MAMKHCGTKTLETDRLILRRFREDDAEAMFRNWASDPEVTKFLTWPTHTSVDVSKYVLSLWLPEYEKPDYYQWVITLKENGDEPLGTIHGLIKDELGLVTAGYCLSRKFWHQGIMSEALGAVMDFFFDAVGCNRVAGRHDPRNPHSGMVMQKCGMRFEGVLRSADRNNQGICDVAQYAVLKSDLGL